MQTEQVSVLLWFQSCHTSFLYVLNAALPSLALENVPLLESRHWCCDKFWNQLVHLGVVLRSRLTQRYQIYTCPYKYMNIVIRKIHNSPQEFATCGISTV